MSDKETWDIKDISEEVHELVKKAAKHDKMGIKEWVEETLKNAAQDAIEPEKIITDPAKLGEMLRKINKRLDSMEKNPLNSGARMVTEGAKALGESARDIYERVEARKWFDKSYETAAKACDTLGQHFKTWWESRGGSTTTAEQAEQKTNADNPENVVDAEFVEEETTTKSKTKKEKEE